jgi:hypothetical protein
MITNLRDDKMIINQAKIEIEVLKNQKAKLADRLHECRVGRMEDASNTSKLISEVTQKNYDLAKENDRLLSLFISKSNKKVSIWSKIFG